MVILLGWHTIESFQSHANIRLFRSTTSDVSSSFTRYSFYIWSISSLVWHTMAWLKTFAEWLQYYQAFSTSSQWTRLQILVRSVYFTHIIQSYPRAASITDFNGKLPLYYAIEQSAPFEVVEAIYHANAAALSHVQIPELNFALQAAIGDAPVSIIYLLLVNCPSVICNSLE